MRRCKVLLLLLTFTTFAIASDYSGIWVMNGNIDDVVSIHQSGDRIVMIRLNNNSGFFETNIGDESSNIVRLVPVYADNEVIATYDISLLNGRLLLRQVSCTPLFLFIECANTSLQSGERLL